MTTNDLICSMSTDQRIINITRLICKGQPSIVEDLIQEVAFIWLKRKIELINIWNKSKDEYYALYYGFCWQQFNSSTTKRQYNYDYQKKDVSIESLNSRANNYRIEYGYEYEYIHGSRKTESYNYQIDLDEERRRQFEYSIPEIISPCAKDSEEENYYKSILREVRKGKSIRNISRDTGICHVTLSADYNKAIEKILKPHAR